MAGAISFAGHARRPEDQNSKQAETKQAETQQAETQQAETEQAQTEQAETQQAETQQAETQQAETEQAETQQAETQQAETEQAETEQAETQQAETEQAETEQAKRRGRHRRRRPPVKGRRRPVSLGRRVVGGVGRTLVGAGVLLLLFVAYQLAGTNVAEAHSQTALRQAFSRQLHAQPATTVPAPASTLPAASPPAPPLPGPPPAEGTPVATMHIPKIGLDKVVIQGVGTDDLRQAPGHYPSTSMLGQPGNAAVAGHRTTYGAPFYRLDELTQGDPIYVNTSQGAFEYDVAKTTIVNPSDVSVLDPTPGAQLTLTTCNPRFSAAQRLVVVADLVSRPAPATAQGAPATRRAPPSLSLSGRQVPLLAVVAWGIGLVLVALLVWLVARSRYTRWRRAVAYTVGALPFLAVLFFFFTALSPLLPAQY